MSRAEISALVEQLASLAAVVRSADPADKAEIYRGLNLTLTYQPAAQIVRAEARLATDSHGVMVWCPRGELPLTYMPAITGELVLCGT
jgi:site-specific DNA recombinase